ncbi:tyrosine-type recombinase/integrase [Ascidiaceihabitans sp.]|nr:tyrosine-type recombinase/integrase [Ascidiaceihabitans sp.]MDA9135520.1 tyrosine-type recombinase/integrase [Ascidiaceihabitans sp.]
MLHDIPYLTMTAKTKVYGYRRRIPKDVCYMFSNKSEIVRSFKTKSLAVAQVEVDRLNKWFDERLETVGYSRKQDNLLPAELVRKVHDDLKMMGEHPDDVPMIGIRSELDEVRKLAEDFAYTQNVYKDYKSGQITYDNFLELEHAYNNGIYGKILNHHERANLLLEELHSKYHDGLKWDEHDPEVVRYRLMMGENLVPPPTWQNATDSYIRQYRRSKKQRNPEQLVKHSKSTEKLCIRFSAHLSAGMRTPLKEIDTQDVEAFVDGAGVSDSTNAKNLTIFRAVWNSWNKHNAKQSVEGDPFAVAVNDSKEAANTSAKIRRSMIPSEFDYFCTSIANEPDPEVQMIGKIMAYCGAPTIEAAKLQRSDVKLDSAVPYIVFRSTEDSITGKDRLDRAVPLVGALLDDLRDYVRDHYISGKRGSLETQRLFPSLGYGIHSASMRSKVLKRHVKNLRPTDPKLLSPYSLRHTFKDRASKAGVRTDIAEYLHGHKSKQSSAIHRKYGTKMPASETVDLMLLINGVSEWGFIEDYDE